MPTSYQTVAEVEKLIKYVEENPQDAMLDTEFTDYGAYRQHLTAELKRLQAIENNRAPAPAILPQASLATTQSASVQTVVATQNSSNQISKPIK